MPKFIVRVELRNYATQSDYDLLHHAMEARGYRRYIMSDSGQRYLLPTAEYFLDANMTVEQVRDAASAAAMSTNKQHWVLATEYVRCSWTTQAI